MPLVTFDDRNVANYQAYTTSELDTGCTWVDGKTIYRKVYTGTTGTNTNYMVDSSLKVGSYVDTPIKAYGQLGGGTKQYMNVGSYLNSNFYCGTWWTDSGISLYYSNAGKSMPYILVVEYTKT